MASAYENGLSLAVVSKAYGLAGLRVGWIAMQNRALLKEMERIKYYLSICNSAPSEILTLMALRAKDTILARNHALLQVNLPLLDQFFKTHADQFSWVRPKGGCIGFARYHAAEPIDAFAERLLVQESVLVLPGSVYGDTNNHFRISYGRRNMPEALRRMENMLDTL